MCCERSFRREYASVDNWIGVDVSWSGTEPATYRGRRRRRAVITALRSIDPSRQRPTTDGLGTNVLEGVL